MLYIGAHVYDDRSTVQKRGEWDETYDVQKLILSCGQAPDSPWPLDTDRIFSFAVVEYISEKTTAKTSPFFETHCADSLTTF